MDQFTENRIEQWQEVNSTPFEEAEELPFPAIVHVVSENLRAAENGEPAEKNNAENADIEDMDATNTETEDMETEGVEAEDVEEIDAEKEETAERETEEAEEGRKRNEHEAAEAKRKAEWEARQQAKKDAEQRELERLNSMTEEEVIAASMKRVEKDTERLTRRNMKECVSEYVQTICLEDPDFARLAMHPRKSMINCFRYINRKAREFVEQEMKDNDIKPENGVYGSDVPDDLCYQWAEDYFRDPDAPEDKPEKEEKFVPKPYAGKTSYKSKKKAEKKKPAEKKKEAEKKPAGNQSAGKAAAETEADSLTGQMSLMDFFAAEEKAS